MDALTAVVKIEGEWYRIIMSGPRNFAVQQRDHQGEWSISVDFHKRQPIPLINLVNAMGEFYNTNMVK